MSLLGRPSGLPNQSHLQEHQKLSKELISRDPLKELLLKDTDKEFLLKDPLSELLVSSYTPPLAKVYPIRYQVPAIWGVETALGPPRAYRVGPPGSNFQGPGALKT